MLHQSFSESWASLNREAVEEAGKLGEVGGFFWQNWRYLDRAEVAQYVFLWVRPTMIHVEGFQLVLLFCIPSPGDVLDAIWRTEVEAAPSDGLGGRPDC